MAALWELDRSAVVLEADHHPVPLQESKFVATAVFRGKVSRLIQPGEELLAQPGNWEPQRATVTNVEHQLTSGTATVSVTIQLPQRHR